MGQTQAQSFTVSGRYILDPEGEIYHIHGIARSGFETSSSGDGHFTRADFSNIASWGANTVRIPVDQEYALPDAAPGCYNPDYLLNLDSAITAAHNAGLNVILDLHWSYGKGPTPDQPCGDQWKMADLRSLRFWEIMARHYKDNPEVFFELYNEPFIESWDCWLKGCMTDDGWWAAGMQEMYNTVRNAGFKNLVIIGGLNFAFDLSGVPTHQPRGFNIVYATHPYDYPDKQVYFYQRAFGFMTEAAPVIATEFGDYNCSPTYIRAAMSYFDAPEGDTTRRMGWVGWAWNQPGNEPDSCGFPSIITDWNGAPNRMGQPEHDAMLRYASDSFLALPFGFGYRWLSPRYDSEH